MHYANLVVGCFLLKLFFIRVTHRLLDSDNVDLYEIHKRDVNEFVSHNNKKGGKITFTTLGTLI